MVGHLSNIAIYDYLELQAPGDESFLSVSNNLLHSPLKYGNWWTGYGLKVEVRISLPHSAIDVRVTQPIDVSKVKHSRVKQSVTMGLFKNFWSPLLTSTGGFLLGQSLAYSKIKQ